MNVVIGGTLDTEGEELEVARDVMASQGIDVHIANGSIMGDPQFEPDTTAPQVAEQAGTTMELRESGDRGEAMSAMGKGAAAIVTTLHEEGEPDGILGLGGSGNTSIATSTMRELPYGVPKLMVSPMASGDVRPYVGSKDIMMYSVADIEGLNQLSRRIITNAALATVGMVGNTPDLDSEDEPTIGVTMFGVKLVGGVLSAGPQRLEAAGETGTPRSSRRGRSTW